MISGALRRFSPSLAGARRLTSHVAALAAYLAMASSGELPLAANVLFGLGLLVSLARRDRAIRGMGPLLVVGTAGVGVVMLFLVAQGQLDLVLGASIFASAVTLNRLLGRRSAKDDPLLLLTTLLMLAAAAALSGEAAYGACFVLYGFAATLALTFSHLELAADEASLSPAARNALLTRSLWGPLSGLAVLALLGAGAVFVLFPRVNAQWLGRQPGAGVGSPLVGFNEQVQLGGYGALRSDPRPALRVRFPELDPDRLPRHLVEPGGNRLTILWRGQALDSFDGHTWSIASDAQTAPRPLGWYPPKRFDLHAQIDVLPVAGARALFSPGPAVAAKLHEFETDGERLRPHLVLRRSTGDVVIDPAPQGFYAYEVWTAQVDLSKLRGAGRDYPPEVVRRDLQLPKGLDPRLGELARSWVGGATDPAEQAAAIRAHLQREYRYTTELGGNVADPVTDFLFVRKAGHCEYFSTAMALMLRTLGVPAREVTGFEGGIRAPGADYFLVRAGDAHSWVEVFIPGQGFVPMDPTPDRGQGPGGLSALLAALGDEVSARWRTAILEYNLRTQITALQAIGHAFSGAADRFARDPETGRAVPWRKVALGLVPLGLIAVVVLARRRSKRRSEQPGDEAARAYGELLRLLHKRGVARDGSETARELAGRLEQQARAEALAVKRFTALYEQARYAGAPWSTAERAQVGELLRGLRR